jgi:hypothetical protein
MDRGADRDENRATAAPQSSSTSAPSEGIDPARRASRGKIEMRTMLEPIGVNASSIGRPATLIFGSTALCAFVLQSAPAPEAVSVRRAPLREIGIPFPLI